jgi:hypothetical protein
MKEKKQTHSLLLSMVADFGTLRVALAIATTQNISLSPFRLVTSDNTTKRQTGVVALSS